MLRQSARSISACVCAIFLASVAASLGETAEDPVNAEFTGYAMQGAPVMLTSEMAAEIAQNKRSIEQRGYVERPTQQSQAQFALARIKEREEGATEMVRRTGQTVSASKRGFYRVGVDALPTLPLNASKVPVGFERTDSQNYVLPLPHQLTRIYSKTPLGALLVREVENATLYAEGPDAKQDIVGGFPVYMTTTKYAGNNWATFIIASKDNRVVQIEVGARITTARQRALLNALVASVLGAS